MAATERRPITSESIGDAIADLIRLSGPDGPAFQLGVHDDRRRTVAIRVVLDTAECDDCVLPPPALADLITHHIREAVGDCTVVVDDPRSEQQQEAP